MRNRFVRTAAITSTGASAALAIVVAFRFAQAQSLSSDRPNVVRTVRAVSRGDDASTQPTALRVVWQRTLPVSRLPVAVGATTLAVSAKGQLFTLALADGNDSARALQIGQSAGAPAAIGRETYVVANASDEVLLVRGGAVVGRFPRKPIAPGMIPPRALPLADGGYVYTVESTALIADGEGFVRRSTQVPTSLSRAFSTGKDLVLETLDGSQLRWSGSDGFSSVPRVIDDARGCNWSGPICVQSERIMRLGEKGLDLVFRAPTGTSFVSGLSARSKMLLVASSTRLSLLELAADDKELRRVPLLPLLSGDAGAPTLFDLDRQLAPIVDRAGNVTVVWEGQAIRVREGGGTETLDICDRGDVASDLLESPVGLVFACRRGRIGVLR